jgi:long-chain acyl-CoA synthetase
MLYDRWREIARKFAGELALRDLPTGRSWTFAQLDAAVQGVDSSAVFPQGNRPEFIIDVLSAWRSGRVVCPIEPGQPAPVFPSPPPASAHLKLTSATSGSPNLVAFRDEQLAADAQNIVETMGLSPGSPNLGFVSLAHSYGFSNLVTPLLLHGIPLFLGGTPLPEMLRRALEQCENTTLAAVPALWRVWQQADVISNRIRLAISAGAPLPLGLEQEVFARHGVKIHNFYGASECGGIAYDGSATPRSDAAFAGAAMRNVDLRVNSAGCLEVRGANVGETYWPEADDALRDGVYRTSDVAELRAEGVWLRGRASDVINVAGRKIAPETIERLLLGHPGVRECLVFGTPSADSERGETIVATVVASAGTSAESIRAYLLDRSDAWQVPREFWFVDSLQPNERGKLSRPDWRQRFLNRNRKG